MATNPYYDLTDTERRLYLAYLCLSNPERLIVDYALGIVMTPGAYIFYDAYIALFSLLPPVDKSFRSDHLAFWLDWSDVEIPDVGRLYYVSTGRLLTLYGATIKMLGAPSGYRQCRETTIYNLVKPSM